MGLSEEAATLGHILLMDAKNQPGISTDAYRHGSELWQLDAECSSWGRSLAVLTAIRLAKKFVWFFNTILWKNVNELFGQPTIVAFPRPAPPPPMKVKIFFGFL